MDQPILSAAIPPQAVNEQAAYGPFDLNRFVQAPALGGALRFQAELNTGASLPRGIICTSDGVMTGIPAKGTQGLYEIVLTISNDAGSIYTDFIFEVKPSMASGMDYFSQLKQQVWEALEQRVPIPELEELYNRPITAADIYHFIERWGVIKIWDAFNLETPGELVPLSLPGASNHYVVYDRGSCLVAGPKDLFSDERTPEDGLQTARALAREVFKRNWTIEMAGLDKLTRAVWVEVQTLGERQGRYVDIVNYQPSAADERLFQSRKTSSFRPET